MTLIESEMPVNKAAKILSIWAPRLWRIFAYWIRKARSKVDLTGLNKIGMDETSAKRGHKHVMLSVDLDKKRVIFACPGKDEDTFKKLHNYLIIIQVDLKEISHFSIDMSPALIGGIQKHFPGSAIVYDRFHIKKLLNESMDKLRKLERKKQ